MGRGDKGDAILLTAAQAAARAAITVRALRVYEARGLLTPPRTAKGWRLYGENELRRLAAIQSLKALGLPLADIAVLLRGHTPALGRLLHAQATLWRSRLMQAQAGLALVEQAIARHSAAPLSIDDLCHLIQRLDMRPLPQTLKDVIAQDFSPAEQRAFTTPTAPPAEVAAGTQAWATLIADIQALMRDGVPATDPRAQAAASRWRALVTAFTKGDEQAEQRAATLWSKALDRTPSATPNASDLPFDRALWDYVQAAMTA